MMVVPPHAPMKGPEYPDDGTLAFSHTLLFSELFVFSPTGQLLSATAAGAAPSLSSGTGAAFGGDLVA